MPDEGFPPSLRIPVSKRNKKQIIGEPVGDDGSVSADRLNSFPGLTMSLAQTADQGARTLGASSRILAIGNWRNKGQQ
jgi:hypothetical protein